jgi:alanine racemase
MTVRLTIERQAWLDHVHETFRAYGTGLVPVVKGNGYGFGRGMLHGLVDDLGSTGALVAVGSVHELHDVPDGLTPVVLTPTLAAPTDTRAILTVGAREHLDALVGWPGRVIVKLVSSMHRYGFAAGELASTIETAARLGLDVAAAGLHLPLAGDDTARLAEIRAWLPHLPPATPLWVSHLTPESFRALRADVTDREVRIRVGTALWHGVPRGGFLRLTADVVQVTPVHAGDRVGYHEAVAPADGTVVAIGAGTAAGIAPLDASDPSRRSPFHFARHRLVLLEGPHMHASLVFVPAGQPCPMPGDDVDVQRPLITTTTDELRWR